jgi:hypothetical protein
MVLTFMYAFTRDVYIKLLSIYKGYIQLKRISQACLIAPATFMFFPSNYLLCEIQRWLATSQLNPILSKKQICWILWELQNSSISSLGLTTDYALEDQPFSPMSFKSHAGTPPPPPPQQQQQQEEEAGQHSWAPGRLSRVSA